MMDSVTDESSPHLHSNLTLLIVINIISVSSLSYCSEPVSCPEALALLLLLGFAPLPLQSVAVLSAGPLLPVPREQMMEMEPGVWGPGSGGWPVSC